MPVYDYECAQCGPFAALRPMALCAEPDACPLCGEAAPRAFRTPPALALMDAARRSAIATNERAAHSPKRAHGPGCGCCSPGLSRARQAPGGAKSFPAARPWMISH